MTNQKSTIDLSRFVAIGDSITTGYADGALYYKSQVNAYPNLLARQYSLIHPIVFKQALIDKQSPGIGFIGRSKLILVPDVHNPKNKWGQLSYLAAEGDSSILTKNNYKLSGPYHNMAVPGAKAAHLIMPGYGDPGKGAGNYNPFFTRMASDPQRTSVLADIMAMKPGFFTLFIGNNDVLAYAMHGGTTDVITPLEGKVGEGFAETLRYITEALTNNGAKGILATIPDITTIPLFNTISYNQLLLGKEEAEQLNIKYAKEQLHFKSGSNAFVIETVMNGEPGIAQLKAGEMILADIMQDELRTNYLSGQTAIPKKYYLTLNEISLIKETIHQYNKAILARASELGLGIVNLNNLLKNVKPDRTFDAKARAIHYTETGVFSLDGMHINSMGQALLANEFIKAIYQKFGLRIPRVPIVQFRKKHRITMNIK